MSDRKFVGGPYARVQAACDGQPDTVAVFIPPLVHVLERTEAHKDLPLTEAEVIAARDVAPAIQMLMVDFHAWSADRGRDLDPNDVWAQWRRFKLTGELTYPPPPGGPQG